jgi:hypothetical protein
MALQVGISLLPATIANGTSLSGEVDLGALDLVGIQMPAAWTAASMTFQVSVDGGVTWLEHTSSAGTETTFTVAASQYIAVDPTLWRGVNAVKVRSGTLGSPVNQGQAVTLNLVCRTVN